MTTDRDIDRAFDALFDDVMRMSDAELRMIRGAWEESDTSQRESAWEIAHTVMTSRNRQQYMDDARATLSRWAGSLSHTSVPFGHAEWIATSGMATPGVRRDAIPPILDAVAAIVASDGLDPDERDTLLAPLTSVARADADR